MIKPKGWHRPCNGQAISQEAKGPTASLKDCLPVYHCGQCWFVARQEKYMASDKCCRGWTRKNEVTNRNWSFECKGYLEDWCREDEESIQSYTLAGFSSFMQIKLIGMGTTPSISHGNAANSRRKVRRPKICKLHECYHYATRMHRGRKGIDTFCLSYCWDQFHSNALNWMLQIWAPYSTALIQRF